MSAFFRFTLLVAALCVAAALGYAAGVRKAGPVAASDERMTIDTHGSPASTSREPITPKASVTPEPKAADATAQDPDAGTTRELEPPTSIDEILRRQSSQPPSAD